MLVVCTTPGTRINIARKRTATTIPKAYETFRIPTAPFLLHRRLCIRLFVDALSSSQLTTRGSSYYLKVPQHFVQYYELSAGNWLKKKNGVVEINAPFRAVIFGLDKSI